MLSGIISLSLYMTKATVNWEILVLHNDHSFSYLRRQMGQADPLASPWVALTASPFFCVLGIRLLFS